MRVANIILSSLFLIICPYLYFLTYSFPPSLRARIPGPAYWPRIVLFMMVIFSLIIFISNVRKRQDTKDTIEFYSPVVIKAIITIVAFFIMFPFIGYINSLIFIFFILLLIAGFRTAKILAILPIVFFTIIYSFFKLLLKVPFPTGNYF